MYNDAQLLEMRVDRFVREQLLPGIDHASAPVTITAWEVPDEPVPFANLDLNAFAPFELGQPWGHTWGTVWFRLVGTVPAEWDAVPGDNRRCCTDPLNPSLGCSVISVIHNSFGWSR